MESESVENATVSLALCMPKKRKATEKKRNSESNHG
jgi:hypothetical protein